MDSWTCNCEFAGIPAGELPLQHKISENKSMDKQLLFYEICYFRYVLKQK